LADEMVRAMQFTLCGVTRRLPVYLPRPDVHASINAEALYPALHALCSGISGRIPLTDLAFGDGPIPVDVAILTVSGRAIPRRRQLIRPDDEGILVN
ncbi:MAG TPA: hypothetical protein VGM42_13875, partial [Rhodopila sp.]